MIITDELRKAADDIASTAVPCGASPDYIGVRRKIDAIADRIDAEHQKAIRELNNLAEASVLLPKDADGEYIHVGDVMEEHSGHTFEVASLMAFGGSDNWLVLSDPRNFSSFREPHDIRHYHAPTVEDVLREFGDWYAHTKGGCDEDGIIAEYAAKLQLREVDE